MLTGESEKDIREVLKLELTAEPHELKAVIKEKIAEMNEASRRLDFELAALLRDEIVVLKEELKQK